MKVHINRLRVFFFFLNDFILLFSNDEIMATNFNKFQHGIRNSVVVVATPTQRYTDAWASLAPLWLNLTKSGVSKDSVSPPSSEYTPLLCSW